MLRLRQENAIVSAACCWTCVYVCVPPCMHRLTAGSMTSDKLSSLCMQASGCQRGVVERVRVAAGQ